jgi:hypothetical protein
MSAPALETPPVRRFTADEFWRMCELGILREEERLELIDDEIHLVSPSGWDHAWVVDEIARRLGLAYGLEDHAVRVRSNFLATEWYSPEPDVCVRPRTGPWLAERRHPRADEMLIVVGVAASRRRLDGRKVRLYAQAGAPAYWIVDIPSRTATAHSGPRPDGTWDRVSRVTDGAELQVPGVAATIRVADILPPDSPSKVAPERP